MITKVVVARGEVVVERTGSRQGQQADMVEAHQLVANIAHTMGWERASYHRDDATAGQAPEATGLEAAQEAAQTGQGAVRPRLGVLGRRHIPRAV